MNHFGERTTVNAGRLDRCWLPALLIASFAAAASGCTPSSSARPARQAALRSPAVHAPRSPHASSQDAGVQGTPPDTSRTTVVDSGHPDGAVQRALPDASTTTVVDSGQPDARNAASTAQDGGAWVLAKPGVGALGLRLGHSTLRDALKRLGRPTRTIRHGTYTVETVFKRRHLSLFYCARDPRKRIFLMAFTSGSKAKTPAGIHIGSTAGQVLDSYGRTEWAFSQGSPYCDLDYPGVMFYVERLEPDCQVLPPQTLVELDVLERGFTDCGKLYPAPW